MAAALLLTACGKTNAGSGSSGSMSGSSGTSSAQTQTAAWKTGLGVVTEATDQDRAGKIELAAAAVLLDGEGKLESILLDELEVSVSADSTGHVTLPTDWRTKRQKGDDYPLAEVSSLKKGWGEQADAFASYLIGMTPEQVSMLKVDKDGKPTDADLLSGCTIAVDRYRDAVTRACANARALGAAKGDRAALGIEAVNGTSDITATDDKDVNAQVDVSIVALTTDADRRVTSAIADMAEPALTVVSDGGVTAPDLVKTKLELGEDYGMRGASALGKEWYEHSEGGYAAKALARRSADRMLPKASRRENERRRRDAAGRAAAVGHGPQGRSRSARAQLSPVTSVSARGCPARPSPLCAGRPRRSPGCAHWGRGSPDGLRRCARLREPT